VDVTGTNSINAEPLFCCQVTWIERESRLRRGLGQLDRMIDWLGALFDFNWNSPWRKKVLATGDVFASNLEVADYFSQVHGLTRKLWLEEQMRSHEQWDELARLQAKLRPGGGFFVSGTGGYNPAGRATLDAKAAFDRFCRISTNVAAKDELVGPTNGGPPIRSETTPASSSAHSDRSP
jgi:hypothetical protein